MGCILNRFDQLSDLARDKEVSERFKLTAIIVHDPEDRSLKKHISSHFLTFAKLTGDNFLFITFVQPPKEHAEAIKRGEYKYARLLVSDSKQQSNTDAVINPLVRSYYNLPKEGSYLVIAKKLSDKEVFKVPITTATLFYQLDILTSYCDSPYNFDELIKKLNGEAVNIEEQIGKSLLKIVSLISPSSSLDNIRLHSYSQREMAKKTIAEEKQKLDAILRQSSDDEDLSDKVLKLYKIIEYAYMNVFNEGRRSICVRKCENYNLLDGDSKRFWDTYSRLFFFIEDSSRDNLDYSAFILYLGKIVENELNLSVCQMLRQAMGIAMPDFYNRYCYRTDKVYIPTERQDVPLNKYIYKHEEDRKQLESVALGNLLHAYKTAIGMESSYIRYWRVQYPENLVEIPVELLPIWDKIAILRNDAAHSRSVSAELYNNIYEYFNRFQGLYMTSLYPIKEKLRLRRRIFNQQSRR